jgi:hypothetical protein
MFSEIVTLWSKQTPPGRYNNLNYDQVTFILQKKVQSEILKYIISLIFNRSLIEVDLDFIYRPMFILYFELRLYGPNTVSYTRGVREV